MMTVDENTALFRNALSVNDGFPMRFTPAQFAYFRQKSPEFAARVQCSSGVKLSFWTDAAQLQFDYCIVAWCRSTNVVDVFENGIHTGSVRLPDMQSTGCFAFQRVTSGMARIDIWLPTTCGIRVTRCVFGRWRQVSASKKRLLLLGDSILQGIECYHPSCSLGNWLLCREDCEGVNQSVGGACFDTDALDMLSFQPDHIWVALGANDAFGDTAYQQQIPLWFVKLRDMYRHVGITAITPIWSRRTETDAALAARFQEVAALICEQGSKHGVRVVNGWGLVPHHPHFYQEDGIHPNDLGFLQYALHLSEAIPDA